MIPKEDIRHKQHHPSEEMFIRTQDPWYVNAHNRKRFTAAMTISLLLHGALLSLQFGTAGLGFPGLRLPWNERRAHAPGLTVHLNLEGRSVNASSAAPIPVPLGVPSTPSQGAAVGMHSPPPIVRKAPAPLQSNIVPVPEVQANRAESFESAQAKGSVAEQPQQQAKPARVKKKRRATPSEPRLAKADKPEEAFMFPTPLPEANNNEAADDIRSPAPSSDSPQIAQTVTKDHREQQIAMQQENKSAEEPLQKPAAKGDLMLSQQQFQAEKETDHVAMLLEAQRQAERITLDETLRRAEQIQVTQAEELIRQQAMELEAQKQAEEEETVQAMNRRIEEENLARLEQLRQQNEENERREAQRIIEEAAQQQARQKAEEEDNRLLQQAVASPIQEESTPTPLQTASAPQQEDSMPWQAESAPQQEDSMPQQAESAPQQPINQQVPVFQPSPEQHAALPSEGNSGEPVTRNFAPGAASPQDNDQSIRAQAAVSAPEQPIISEPTPSAPVVQAEEKPPVVPDSGPIMLSDEQLAGLHVEQVRKIDVTRMNRQAAHELASAVPESRRRSVFGSAQEDIVLKMYVESWCEDVVQKANQDYLQAPQEKPRGSLLVTVAIRSDGSIENVSIHRAGAQPNLDEAVHHIVQLSDRYRAFPADLKKRYDVIEVRRLWRFDDTLHIVENTR